VARTGPGHPTKGAEGAVPAPLAGGGHPGLLGEEAAISAALAMVSPCPPEVGARSCVDVGPDSPTL
jgi:hypothetical protein